MNIARSNHNIIKPISNLFVLFIYSCAVQLVSAQQSYCWEPCTANCPKYGPRLCPPENILTYFDCCPGQGCCQYIKWTNVTFLILIIFLLLMGCVCCFVFLFHDARQRVIARTMRENANTITSIAEEPTIVQTKNHLSTIVKHEDIKHPNNNRSYSIPSTSAIYYKRSTIV